MIMKIDPFKNDSIDFWAELFPFFELGWFWEEKGIVS